MSPMQNRGEKLELGPSAGPQVPRQVDDRHKGLLRSLGSCRKQSTTGPWAMLEFNTEATRPSQRESHQTFSERKTPDLLRKNTTRPSQKESHQTFPERTPPDLLRKKDQAFFNKADGRRRHNSQNRLLAATVCLV